MDSYIYTSVTVELSGEQISEYIYNMYIMLDSHALSMKLPIAEK